MSRCYAYIRVSTAKQAEKGVSLQEQRAAITRYAASNSIDIVEWFEECVTAAKQGRPIFNRMLKKLRSSEAQGVVIHKIDRSARNLRDWAEMGELVDAGVLVHFANESMDLKSRGGRLSADIQAVVAADYIRNLREEILKGISGRLKEGLTPFTAPLGYRNNGKGAVKTIDAKVGPLVREAFELYASGRYSLHPLLAEMKRRGLRNRAGKPISLNGLAEILKNPFYIGKIRLKSTGETFPGKHAAIVSRGLFNTVKARLNRRAPTRVRIHDFLFRGLFRCSLCSRRLVGELQKGHVYYRCQTKSCPTRTFREEVLEETLLRSLPPIAVSVAEKAQLMDLLRIVMADEDEGEKARLNALRDQLTQSKERQTRLVDAFLDGVLDKDSFEARKLALLEEQRQLEDSLEGGAVENAQIEQFLNEALELASVAQQSYFLANVESRRELILRTTSNRTASGKEVVVEPYFPLQTLATRPHFLLGAPSKCGTRTLKKVMKELIEWAKVEVARIKEDPDDPWAGVIAA